jgi:hypothetical protein
MNIADFPLQDLHLPPWAYAIVSVLYALYRLNNAFVGRSYRPPEGSLLHIAGWLAGTVWRDTMGSVKAPLSKMPSESIPATLPVKE